MLRDTRNRLLAVASTLLLLFVALPGAVKTLEGAQDSSTVKATAVADKLFEEQNFNEAAEAYSNFLESVHPPDELWHAGARLAQSRLRMAAYDEALETVRATIRRFAGTVREARAWRMLGNLYLVLPHQGTEKGGKFYRGRWDQGKPKDATRADQRAAVEALEKARDLYLAFQSDPAKQSSLAAAERTGLLRERIDCQFDLAAALTRFGPQDARYYGGGGEEADPDDDTVGEEAEEMPYSKGRYRGSPGGMERPRGLPVDAAGKPVFDPMPAAYSGSLPAGQKVKFLLAELQKLDASENQDDAALALYRRAMLARARYGPHRLNEYGGFDPQPEGKDKEARRLEDLADNEALTLVGTRLARITLPEDEDVLGLLSTVAAKYPKSASAPNAQYAVGLYHASRRQFREAIRELERLERDFPGSACAGRAQVQMKRIRQPEVHLKQLGVQLAGQQAHLPLTCRNTAKVQFTAYKLDLDKLLADFMDRIEQDREDRGGLRDLENLSYTLLQERDNGRLLFRQYAGQPVATWDSTVNDAGDHRYATAEVTAPFSERGCYVLEASCTGGRGPSRNLVLLSDLALVVKHYKDQQLYFAVDARTGQPVAGAKLQHFQYWSRWLDDSRGRSGREHFYASQGSGTTDADGVSLFKTERKFDSTPRVITIARSPAGSMAFEGLAYWSDYYHPSSEWRGRRQAIFTDRPVYRPQQTVKFKGWMRDYRGGEYQPVRTQQARVRVRDPRGNVVLDQALPVDSCGSLEGSFRLEKGAPLGLYNFELNGSHPAGGQLRVEEYKKPEFEVEVKVKSDLVRLGEKVEGSVVARYYFGAPVTRGRATYKVFREELTYSYVGQGYWDWLYGPGYGRAWYDYKWLPWWTAHGPRPARWFPWWGAPPRPERELVAEGSGELGEDGTLAFTVDSSAALRDHPDQDHLYTIEAEVVDASRRNIRGSGQLKVTRQEFYAFLEVDRGYYEPGEPIQVTVKALTANDLPVASSGKLHLSAIRYRGEGGSEVALEAAQTYDAATDAQGNAQVSLKAPASGQYKLSYETTDSRGKPVVGAQVLWVRGQDFQGATYRFADLELLTDKRTYQPGETAHLMINTDKPGAAVLFSHHMDRGVLVNYRVLTLAQKSTTLDLPIEAADVPNFFVEGTVVADGKVRQEARELFVPPADHVMNVEVKPAKAEFRPGEEAEVRLKATSPDGKPVAAQFALSVFDRSVLYIQPELTPDLRKHFWGTTRSHNFQSSTNLDRKFDAIGYLEDPVHYIDSDAPEGWHGSWGPRGVDFISGDLDYDGGIAMLSESAGAGGGPSARSSGLKFKAQMAMAPAPSAPGRARAKDEVASVEKSAQTVGRADAEEKRRDGAEAQPAYQAAKVRAEFEDTAFWSPSVTTDDSGEATVRFRFPENLTTWKMRALGMTTGARVGDGNGQAVTAKKFVLRLQAPRFFVERDQVVLSANVHNYLARDKKAKVTLTVPPDLMELSGPASVEVPVAAGREARVDWTVRVLKEGFAAIKMEALSDEESDAVQMGFPVLVHGLEKTVSKTGLLRPGGPDTAELDLDVPAERRPEASRLEVRFSPSLAGAMIDAVPYLLDYPYGCTEQTTSRFLPAVLVQKSLLGMGLSLEDLAKAHTNLDSQALGTPADRHGRTPPLGRAPVFSQKELAAIVAAGLERLASFQHSDGGWGWWSDDRSSPYMTAYVVWSLRLASENDVALPQGMLERGVRALQAGVTRELADWKEPGHGAWDQQAFLAYVLALNRQADPELNALLFERRLKLTLYGKALLSLALRLAQRSDEADQVLRNLRQFEKRDAENQSAWYELPQEGWWFWWNNDIETHAWILKAIVAKDPKDEAAPGLVKWLLNNRRNGTYWRSTRDTAMAVSALVDFMRASGELTPDFTLRVLLDGKLLKETRVTRQDMLALDNKVSLAGEQLTGGLHKLRFERQGTGAVYFSSYLTYFTKEEGIAAAGLEVKVDRKYFKLTRADRTETVAGSRLQDVQERHLRYERHELKEGDRLTSNDLIEVELKLTSKNDYDYLVFEDFKPAGCEPVELRSGARFGELCSNMELRDEKVAFFVGWLEQGEHLIRYRLRAEIPGIFHALPTKGWAMYAPEIRANAAESVLSIQDSAVK